MKKAIYFSFLIIALTQFGCGENKSDTKPTTVKKNTLGSPDNPSALGKVEGIADINDSKDKQQSLLGSPSNPLPIGEVGDIANLNQPTKSDNNLSGSPANPLPIGEVKGI